MLPPEGILRAARRWLTLLTTSSLDQAAAILRFDSRYTDVSRTQYAAALEWLQALGVVSKDGTKGLTESARSSGPLLPQLVFERALALAEPAWLPDGDSIGLDPDDLPWDAQMLADSLGIAGEAAVHAIRQLQGRVDTAERSRLGRAGEIELMALLDSNWPGAATHVALASDGYGYDVQFQHEDAEWHLEVKTTNRRGRLVIYLSRNEYEVARRDPLWRLVIVGLDSEDRLAELATAKHDEFLGRVPCDRHPSALWQSVRLSLLPTDLECSLTFLPPGSLRRLMDSCEGEAAFAWAPAQAATAVGPQDP